MAAEVLERLWSADEYLAWERQQSYRHELIDNRIYPMPGGSCEHENIISALIGFFLSALSPQDGDAYAGGMKVLVDPRSTYTYPDVTVVCGMPRFHLGARSGPLLNPTLLFEVLSPSTQKIDRNRKRELYLSIPSLQGYYLVSQDKPAIEAYTRVGDDWHYSETLGLDASLRMPAIDCQLPLRQIYRRVRFETT